MSKLPKKIFLTRDTLIGGKHAKQGTVVDVEPEDSFLLLSNDAGVPYDPEKHGKPQK